MKHRTVVRALLVAGLVMPVCLAAQTAGLGRLDFPNSGVPGAQEQFIRGVLLMHSFEYVDAAEAFRKAQELDPDFAMAYWGEALSHNHSVWHNQDRDEALAVLERLGATPEARSAKAPTQREKDYLATLEILYGEGDKETRDLAYAEAMRRLHEKYPDDTEAAAFYAVALLGTAHEGRDVRTYMRAAAIAEEIYRDNPEHPGAVHYMIHSYDDPTHAPLGLRAARAYSQIAPTASHAQHMTTHIFMALGMWDEIVSQNEIAWEVADERAQRKGLGVDSRSFHALAWLQYGYLQQGRFEDARRLLAIMRADAEKSGSRRTRTYLARMRANYIVEAEDWAGDAVAIEVDLTDLSPASVAGDLFATGLAATRRGDSRAAEASLAAMQSARRAAVDASGYPPALMAAEALEKELEALGLLADGRSVEAIELLEEATVIEDNIPFEYGPPDIVKPTHELLGEVLLTADRADEARAEFEKALALAPKRVRSLIGLARAAELLDDEVTAQEVYTELKRIRGRADPGIDRFGARH